MIDLKQHVKEEFNFVGVCLIGMFGSFVIAGFFTFLIWLFNLVLDFLGMGKSIPVQIMSNFTEFEGICFLAVFIIINIIKTVKHYTKQEPKNDIKKDIEKGIQKELEQS